MEKDMGIGKVNMKTICLRMRFPEVKPKMKFVKKWFIMEILLKNSKTSFTTKGVILDKILKMV